MTPILHYRLNRSLVRAVAIVGVLLVAACAQVPPQAVELSNTVGRDLEEVHRAHRALGGRFFDLMERDVNRFIDDVYGPAYVTKFAQDFQLDVKISGIVASAPKNLLPVMTGFVSRAVKIIEAKRAELLDPLKVQRRQTMSEIDDAYRQIQAAQSVLGGHLASVLGVQDAQNAALKAFGLAGLRDRISTKTADVSDRISGLIAKGEKANGKMDELEDVLRKIKRTLKKDDTP